MTAGRSVVALELRAARRIDCTGHRKTFGGGGNISYLECDDDFTPVCISKLSNSVLFNGYNLLHINYASIVYF